MFSSRASDADNDTVTWSRCDHAKETMEWVEY